MQVKFTAGKPYPEFEVIELNKTIIHIKVDPETQAFRITSRDNKRVFFIADEVIKKNKVTNLVNEYSIQLGTLSKRKSDANFGDIEFEGMQYTYSVGNGLRKEINLFEQYATQPVLTCKIETGQMPCPDEGYINYLLFGLAWYKFLTRQQPAFSSFG